MATDQPFNPWRTLSLFRPPGRSIINKKSDGSNVKESTDSSTTIEEDDVKGIFRRHFASVGLNPFFLFGFLPGDPSGRHFWPISS